MIGSQFRWSARAATIGAGLALALLTPAVGQAACALNLGWEAFEPFQMKAETQVSGLDVDLFVEAAKDAGCTVAFKEAPWARLLKEIETGKMDAAMGASITPERQAFANFSESYRQDEFVLFVRAGEVDQVGAAGLKAMVGKSFKLGTVRDYAYGDEFDALKKHPDFAKQIDEAAGTEINIRKLISKRLDGFIENRFVTAAVARKENAGDKIAPHPVSVSTDPVYFMFSKKSVPEATVAAINAALAKMKNDGRYNQIVAKYLK